MQDIFRTADIKSGKIIRLMEEHHLQTADGAEASPDLSEFLGKFALDSAFGRIPRANRKVETEAIRSIAVLLDVAAQRPTWLSDTAKKNLQEKVVQVLLAFDPGRADPSQPANKENREKLEFYRRSCLILALSRLLEWSPPEQDLGPAGIKALLKGKRKAAERLHSEAAELIAGLEKATGFDAHPFFIHQLLLALRATEARPWAESAGQPETEEADSENLVNRAHGLASLLEEPLQEKTRELLAKHQLGLDNASDSVALAFSAAAVALSKKQQPRYTRAALLACLASYERSAGWEQGRVVCQDSGKTRPQHRLVVPGAEVYSAIGEAAIESRSENWFLDGDGEETAAPEVLPLLETGLRIAGDSKVDSFNNKGWAVDQVLDSEVVELWPTAAVLNLALLVNEVRHRRDRRLVLEERDAIPTWGDDWPKWLRWEESYRDSADPELENPKGILEFIDDKIVKPRKSEPGRTQSKAAVVLLFGPPGTTKTTIARAVAGGLEWPLVTLSPGNFIEEGLEKLEARAGLIFDQLHRLSRAVVIFDECDELFRARAPIKETESFRNASAFMTASMLPKLQDLHDRGRIVVFICTNFLSSIDPAMRRIGRVDHLIAVPPPDRGQRFETIRRELGISAAKGKPSGKNKFLDDGVAALADKGEYFIRGELINAARELDREKPFSSAKEAVAAAERIAARPGKTINPKTKLYKKFEEDYEELSEPHRTSEGD